eukprot:9826203-Alexandrium_andersonii.AAC.1
MTAGALPAACAPTAQLLPDAHCATIYGHGRWTDVASSDVLQFKLWAWSPLRRRTLTSPT